MESSGSGGQDQPRGKRRLGAVVALSCWALFLLLALLGSGPAGVVWLASGLVACLAGLAVAVGRARARRGDTWQAALVAAGASVLGPLSVALLVIPAVRRSLREAPAQLQGREPETLTHTPDQAVAAHRAGAALALGLAGATLAFWGGAALSVWLAFASSTLTDGGGVALSLFVALIVGAVGFVVVLAVRRRQQALVRVQLLAAAGMVAAIVCVALDGGDLHWSDGNRVSVSFLYVLWALVALLFAFGAAMARPAQSH